MKGIVFILLSGLPWRLLPLEFGSESTIHAYFLEWAKSGDFEDLWLRALKALSETGNLDASLLMIDGSDKETLNMQSEETGYGGKCRGKSAIKLSLIINQEKIPLGYDLAAANQHDSRRFEEVVQNIAIKIPKRWKTNLIGDKGYNGDRLKGIANKEGLRLITPEKKNSIIPNSMAEKILLKKRAYVEHTFKQIYNCRRVRFPFDKTLIAFAGWCQLAMTLIILTKLHEFGLFG